jgi:hypothetical protein
MKTYIRLTKSWKMNWRGECGTFLGEQKCIQGFDVEICKKEKVLRWTSRCVIV